MVPREQPLERFAQIHQQVPAVRNLNRPRRALASAIGVGASPIATENLHARMILQPGGERLAGPFRQQIDDGMPFLVKQDGAVGPTALPGPVVHSQDAGRCFLGQRQRAHEPQERHPAHRPTEGSTQASSGPTTEYHPNTLQGSAENGAPASVAPDKRGGLFGERLLWTGASAEEAADAEVDDDLPAAQRFVGDAPDVAAVDPARATPAGWAVGCRRSAVSLNMNNTVEHQQTLNPQTSEVRKQDSKLQQWPSSAPPQWAEHEKVYRIVAHRFTKSVPEP
jgi:hypothetical protein